MEDRRRSAHRDTVLMIARRNWSSPIWASVIVAAVFAMSSPAQAATPTAGNVTCTKQGCKLVAETPGVGSTSDSSAKLVRVKPSETTSGGANALTRFDVSNALKLPACTGLTLTVCVIAGAVGLRVPGQLAAADIQPVTVTVTPGEVAEMAVSQLQPGAPIIHSSPGTDELTGRVGTETFGLVGMPVWFWTEDLDGATATATAGPFTVTAVAELDHVSYNMGDGQVVNCFPLSNGTVGTPYVSGIEPSRTCGYEGYQKTSRKQPNMKYTITATATWDVTWTGADTGSTALTTEDVGHLPIGEAQAIITSYGASS